MSNLGYFDLGFKAEVAHSGSRCNCTEVKEKMTGKAARIVDSLISGPKKTPVQRNFLYP